MKLERIPEYLLTAGVIVLGLLFSFYAGQQIGSGQTKVVALIVAFALVLVAFRFGRKLWVLIPLVASSYGFLLGLPLSLPLRSMVFLYVFMVFMALKALKIVRMKPVVNYLDLILLINMVYLLVTFIRNPVGALGFETERIGGRPYFQIGAAYLSYWVLSRVTISPSLAFKLPALMTIMPIFEAFAAFLGSNIPYVSGLLGPYYTSFATPEMLDTSAPLGEVQDSGLEGTRLIYLAEPGQWILKVLLSYFRPDTLFNPLFVGRFVLFVIGFVCVFAAGFRSLLADIALAILLSAFFRGGFRPILKLAVFGLPVLVFLVAGQGVIFDLPWTAQRALCFLPGRWDPDVLDATKHSNEWRYDMWEDALRTDLYIHDKIFGDGFGVNRRVWEAVQIARERQINLRIEAEAHAIMGEFHNGAIQTIRVVGVVGLLFYAVLLYGTAWRAIHVLKRAKGTSYYPLAMLMSLAAIATAIDLLHSGAFFEIDLERAIIRIGMLKLISQSLDDYLSGNRMELESPRPVLRDRRPVLTAVS